MTASDRRRLLILTTTTGYQTRSFVEAAAKLGLDVVFGSDRCHVLPDPWQDGALALHFEDAESAAEAILQHARRHRVDAIVALGDRPTSTWARACRALDLPHHSVEATDICRDKYRSRERLRGAGLKVPEFLRFRLEEAPSAVFATGAPSVSYPCVLKPTSLSASRGVIRADDPDEAIAAFERIRALLLAPDVQVLREDTNRFIQVERYIEGREIAIEALLERGRLRVLATFDKPDPLVGPYFEETILVTPSRLPEPTQRAAIEALARSCEALGLYHGPLHAELRVNRDGVWMMEVAARPIGGLCSNSLRFQRRGEERLHSLEEVLIRLALDEQLEGIHREPQASAVMMIPIPEAGIYEDTLGIDDALKTPGVESIEITAKPKHKLVPLPEGATYLGFIFARGESPETAEEAVRSAHSKLCFILSPLIPVVKDRS